MPWKESDPLKERTKFVLEWERLRAESLDGRVNRSSPFVLQRLPAVAG
jgi:hypothetical protein